MRSVSKVFVMIVILAMARQTEIANLVEASLDIGVNYGLKGDNLPSPANVVQLFKKYQIGKIRVFEPVPEVIQALKGSGIQVTLGVRNEDLAKLAGSLEATKVWFDTYVQPYAEDTEFPCIAVGNEVIPGDMAQYVLPLMENLQKVVDSYHYAGIKITTVIPVDALSTSFPPSAGAFSEAASATMTGIIAFLSNYSSPLLVNAYPYFAYASDPTRVRLDYAQFTAPGPVVQDGSLSYSNLLDAQLDAVYSAIEKLGVGDVDLVVAESGWPSAGNGQFTTPALASTYNKNFVKKFLARQGTPKRPSSYIEGFIFAMFNEDLKPAGVEQNWGLFYPDGTPVYPVF